MLGPRIFFRGGGGVPMDNFIFRRCVIKCFGLNYCSCETISIKDIFNAYIFAFLRWFYLGNNEVTGAVTRLKSICIVCNLWHCDIFVLNWIYLISQWSHTILIGVSVVFFRTKNLRVGSSCYRRKRQPALVYLSDTPIQ